MKKIVLAILLCWCSTMAFAIVYKETAYAYSSQDKIGEMKDAWSQWFDCNITLEIDEDNMEMRVIGFRAPTIHVRINDVVPKGDETHFYCSDIKTDELVLVIYKTGTDPQGKPFKSIYVQHPQVNVVFALKM